MTSRGPVRLRKAEIEDSPMLLEWANDREVRRMSFSSEPIAWETHDAWYRARLADDRCLVLIALNEDNVAVGQVRFDLGDPCDAEIHVHMAPAFRGQGLGARVIALAVDHLLARLPSATIHATVKVENVRSRKTFEKAGFSVVGSGVVKDQAVHFMTRGPRPGP